MRIKQILKAGSFSLLIFVTLMFMPHGVMAQGLTDVLGHWKANSNETYEMRIERNGDQVSIEFIETANDVIHSPVEIVCQKKKCVVYEILPDKSRPIFFSFIYANGKQLKIQRPPMVLSEAGRVKFVSSGTVFRKIK